MGTLASAMIWWFFKTTEQRFEMRNNRICTRIGYVQEKRTKGVMTKDFFPLYCFESVVVLYIKSENINSWLSDIYLDTEARSV